MNAKCTLYYKHISRLSVQMGKLTIFCRVVHVKDTGLREVALYSIHSNPLKSTEFCVAGRENSVRSKNSVPWQAFNCKLGVLGADIRSKEE